MLKDRREPEDNEDVDLTGMINEYSQDNELRRKINELKKQKEGSAPTSFDEKRGDSAFMGKPYGTAPKKESAFPNIEVDDDLEKTRVDFRDDSDKTLVIMGQKKKATFEEEPYTTDYEDFDENKTNVFSSNQFAEYDTQEEPEEEDLRETIRKKKQEEPDDEDPEKTAKMNKIITYVIIGVVALCLLVGGFFGVKALLGGSGGDEETEETEEPTKDKTPTKKPTKKPTTDSGSSNIKDNTAKITQLEKQLEEYGSQLTKINTDIANATSAKTTADGKLSNITTLKNNATSAQQNATNLENSLPGLKKAYDDAAALEQTEENKKVTDAAKLTYDTAVTNAATAKQNADAANTAYNTEAANTDKYQKQSNEAQADLDKLAKDKTDIEKKIADTTTELNGYK